MADWVVPIVSVLATTAVALAAIFFQARGASDQRAHEQRLAYEERTWEQISGALVTVVAQCRLIINAAGIESENPGGTLTTAAAARPVLEEQAAAVRAYGNGPTHWMLDRLIER